jgi:DHA3 family tetracycline resistance protein-like MFS transporter
MPTRHRPNASTVYLTVETAGGVLATLFGTVFSVYLIVEGGLSPFRLLILGTVLELSILVFEVPTGVLADVVSRRLSVIVGMAIIGVGFTLTGAVPVFAWLVVGSLLWGLGETFVSGAYQAWITDEVGEEAATQLYVRGAQAWQAGALAGIPLAVAFGAIDLGLPLIASGVGHLVLALALVVAMPEEHFHRAPDGERKRLSGTFRDGVREVRSGHVLMLVLIVAALHGMATEGFDRLSQLHLLEGTSFPAVGQLGLVVWFGVIEAVSLILAIIAAEILKRRADLASHAGITRVLAWIDGALVVSVVVFAFAGAFWLALGLFWTVAFLREIREPVFTAWLNRGLDPATRATVNSFAGQMDAVGQIGGGPTMGAVSVWFGVPAAIAVGGLLRAPAMALYARALRRGEPPGEAPDVEVPPHIEITGMPNPE